MCVLRENLYMTTSWACYFLVVINCANCAQRVERKTSRKKVIETRKTLWKNKI